MKNKLIITTLILITTLLNGCNGQFDANTKSTVMNNESGIYVYRSNTSRAGSSSSHIKINGGSPIALMPGRYLYQKVTPGANVIVVSNRSTSKENTANTNSIFIKTHGNKDYYIAVNPNFNDSSSFMLVKTGKTSIINAQVSPQ